MPDNVNHSPKLTWGEDPDLFGPKDWFRNSLLIRKVRKYVKSGSILDYGCGSGICITRLLKYDYRLLGIDVTEENVRYLQRRFRGNNCVKIHRGDETLLRHMRQPVSAIICGETLEHIEDDAALVQLFRDNLLPDGYVFLSVPAHQSRWSEIDVFAGHFRRYEKDVLRSLFSSNGFTVEELFYYGFPLGTLWDATIADPIMRRKMESGVVYTGTRSWLGTILRFTAIKKIMALMFYIDTVLFPDNPRGTGLILVAKRAA